MKFRLRYLSLLGLVAAASGCATTIAERHPHLDRRSVCLLVPGIENDSTGYIFTENNIPISNFHPEVIDRVAANARTVFEYDPDADPASPQYLPAPYNALECAPRFSMLPSKDAETPPLPEASVDLLVHERRPDVVPKAIAEKLASCASLHKSQLESNQYSMTFNVYLGDDGQAISALLVESTLGDRPTERCIVDVLRSTQWPTATAQLTVAPEPELRRAIVGLAPVAVPPGVKAFFGEPAPNLQPPNVVDRPSGVYRIQPQAQPTPANNPGGGYRPPRIFVIPLGPLAAAGLVFGTILLWPSDDTPAWASEMNPMTGKPYTSRQEYDEVQGLTAQKLLKRPPLRIAATQSQPPPAPAPPPALTPQELREQEKKAEKCGKIAKRIEHILNAERPQTPKGGRPQGRKGISERWREIAANEGNWKPRPDGSLSNTMQGHLTAYAGDQKNLITELKNWGGAGCDDKEHALPRDARQYAAQTPEYGPGKPLEPAPTPEYRPAVIPPVAPQPKKASK